MKLAFYKTGGFWECLIKFLTWGPYSHVEIIFDNGEWFSSRETSGVSITKFDLSLKDWDFIEVPIGEKDSYLVEQWCRKQKGNYDWFGIAHFVLPFIPKLTATWFCSEICITALQQVGLLTNIEAKDYSPNRLYRLVKSWPEGSTSKPDNIPWPHLGK